MSAPGAVNAHPTGESGLIRILPLASIRPSPENDKLYRPVNPSDPEIHALALSIRAQGLLEPLVVSQDRYILSGHRRYAALRLLGLPDARCQVREDVGRADPGFVALLREHNRQREKTADERLREEVVSADPKDSRRRLIEHRQQKARVEADCIHIAGYKPRARISKAKLPMLNAIKGIINALEDFWPLSDRQIHYQLLNAPPLIHASKPDSVYQNRPNCYKALTDLLTRARLQGYIGMNVIGDETRPVELSQSDDTTTAFFRRELAWFLKGYRRNLQQSQPNHIEIVGEKNTVRSILAPVAEEFCIPLTTGRGFCSLPPRHEMAKRFRASGKEKLILLVLSDLDPDGEEICHSFARSMRDDFGIGGIEAVKVAITREHVARFQLPAGGEAKKKSTNYKKFVAQHGTEVFELEALPPATLQALLRESLDSVMDVAAFNAEVEAEEQDAQTLDEKRQMVHRVFRDEVLADPTKNGGETK